MQRSLGYLAQWGRQHAGDAARFLLQVARDLLADEMPHWAAAIAYYALLSAFPLLLAAVSVTAYLVDPGWAIGAAAGLVGQFVPHGRQLVEQTVRSTFAARGPASALSIAVLLWTGSRAFGALTRALNIAFDVDNAGNTWSRLLAELGMLLTLGLLFLVALSSAYLPELVWRVLGGYRPVRGPTLTIVQGVVPAALLLVTLTLAYRFLPRKRPAWVAALVGGGAGAALLLAARPLFLLYVRKLAHYSLIYGTLSVAIALLVWAWLASFMVLLGGELASHVQMFWIEGQSLEGIGRRHRERAP